MSQANQYLPDYMPLHHPEIKLGKEKLLQHPNTPCLPLPWYLSTAQPLSLELRPPVTSWAPPSLPAGLCSVDTIPPGPPPPLHNPTQNCKHHHPSPPTKRPSLYLFPASFIYTALVTMIFVCLFYLITCFGLSLTVEYKPHERRDVLSALFTAVSILPRALGIQ